MVIRYFKRIQNKEILKDILELLTLCDRKFVPPLSARNSTTQSLLSGNQAGTPVPYEYFENIRRAPAFVAMEEGKTVGFMSLKRNYVCPEIPPAMTPNVYITTIIVHPRYRNQGITNQMYSALLERFIGCHIFYPYLVY